ncbi:MAG TPA: hypothetical protein VEG42_06085 [Thermoplasmata archaeon]|jgi:hypothetical protein|nr:hypothetical protein [Thermoplasmata archaeon]HYB79037.1 hypothetical protein [Thermoplasmata archaeon]
MSTPGTVAAPPPPTPPPPPHRKPLYLAVIVAVVVAALLVVFLVLPALTPSSSGASAVLTYRGANPVAGSTVGGYAGGGWTLLFAAGLDSATNETYTVNSTVLGNLTSYCTYTQVASGTSLTLPAFTGNLSSGKAPAWEFGYRNSADVIAIVSVINGHGSVLATLSGVDCAFYAQLFTPVSGNVIDSSAAAAAVEPNASAFLTAHPGVSAEFGLIGGLTFGKASLPAEWEVEYSTCTFGPTASGTGDVFNATVNALTGHVLGWNVTLGASCGGSTTEVVVGPSPVLTSEFAGTTPRAVASD